MDTLVVRRLCLPDPDYVRSVGGAAVLHSLLLGLAFYAPPELEALRLDRFAEVHDRFLSFELKPPSVERTVRVAGIAPASRVAQGPARRPKPGPMGRRGVDRAERRSATKGPKGAEAVRRRVRSLEVFHALRHLGGITSDGPALPDVVSPGDPVTADGNPFGIVIGDSRGTPGGSIDIGGLRPRLGVMRTTPPRLGLRTAEPPPRIIEPGQPPPKIPREAIRRAMRRQRRAIQACYEEALQTVRDLSGKVVVRFIVGPDGTVMKATVASSTLEHLGAERCIVDKVKLLRLPAIPDGGVTEVSYPFVFRHMK